MHSKMTTQLVFECKISLANNADISGALFTLRIQYEYTQTQCKEGARYVNIVL